MSGRYYINIIKAAAICLIIMLCSCSNSKYEPSDAFVEHTALKYEISREAAPAPSPVPEEELTKPPPDNGTPSEEIIETLSIDSSFTKLEISQSIYSSIQNKSYVEGCSIPLSELTYIKVLHYGFDGEIHEGELIVNVKIADDIIEIFKELFEAEYPIEKMVLIDEYGADDNLSMEDNNTSCFNYRVVQGSSTLSNHSYGLAVDINPLYNPYVKEKNNVVTVLPESGEAFTDREADCEYYIKKDDICYNAFIKRGFIWGGDWQTVKDYQHFEKK